MAQNIYEVGAQNLIKLENALKVNYLPAWRNQLNIEPSPILGKIKRVPCTNNKIVATARVGHSGGFGFGAEGQATPQAGNVRYDRFETEAKDMYVNIAISAKAVRLATNAGSMVNALDSEIKAAYETAKWNLGRSLFGNGTGKLANVTAVNEKVITIDDTKNVKEGLIIDLYSEGEETSTTTARIYSVDTTAKTVTLDKDAGITKGFITIQNSYKRELTGLGAIFDTSIDTIYGIKKADNPYVNPITVSAGQDISDGIITKALRKSKNEHSGDVDTLLCGDDAFDAYVDYLRMNNVRVEDMSHTIAGGFKAIKFIFGNKEVDVVNDSFVPNTEMWGVCCNDLELHIQDWDFADLKGGGIFNLMENSSVYRALLANYGNLICSNPGGCVRITDVGYTA